MAGFVGFHHRGFDHRPDEHPAASHQDSDSTLSRDGSRRGLERSNRTSRAGHDPVADQSDAAGRGRFLVNTRAVQASFKASGIRDRSGSVLIIVLWIAFGLVSLALYFAQSMTFELRSADNRAAAIEAEQA